MKVRATLMLDEVVVRKLQAEAPSMSAFVNNALRKELFGAPKSMFGAFKGQVCGRDKLEDDD
ncbi:MAG: hypothetical protein AABW54_02205 [Candidatus Micrarchaeota archaeon]